MKLLYVIGSVGELTQTFAHSLMRGLCERFESMNVVCNTLKGSPSEFPFPIHQSRYLKRALRDTLATRALHKLCPLLCSDALHEQLIARRASRHFYKSVYFRETDVVFIEFGTTAALLLDGLINLKRPFVVQFHGADISKALAKPYYQSRIREVFAHAAGLVCVSEHLRRLLILAGAPREKIHVVRLDIDVENLNPIAWQTRQADGRYACFLGRFTAKKHPVACVEAFRLVVEEVSDAKLRMVGDGPLMHEVRERIAHYGLQNNIELKGALPHDKALAVLNRSMLYIQHSVTSVDGDQEGFPVSIAEAAALALPVVSTIHSGIPEGTIDCETGYLVREHDFETMASRIIEMIKNPERAREMGEAGRRNIARLCAPEKRFDRIADLLTSFCSG